jgi:hypothetical protein
VADILKAITGAATTFVTAWVLPAAIFVGAFVVFVFPAVPDLPIARDIAHLNDTDRGVAIALLPIALGILMSAVSTQFYRLLEGYSWPRPLQDLGIRLQRSKKNRISKRKAAAERTAKARPNEPAWRVSLYHEKLQRFPEDSEIAPTGLANAIRAFETYGSSRFGLDSQTFWTELGTVVPEALQKELERSRASVDFLVGLVYLTLVFALTALVPGLTGVGTTAKYRLSLTVMGAVAGILVAVWYVMAIWSCSYWKSTVRALVNVGRKPLATALGLTLPPTAEAEKEMWQLITGLIFYGYHPAYAKLDRFRAPADKSGLPAGTAGS